MKKLVTLVALGISAALWVAGQGANAAGRGDFPATPISYRDVQVTDDFWAPRLDKTRTVTLPYLLNMAGGRGLDSRLIEAACYFMAQKPDPELNAQIEKSLDGQIQRMRGQMQKWPNTGDGSLGGAGGSFQGAVGLRIEIQLQGKTYKAGLLGPPDANWMREDTTWYEGGIIEWRVNP